MTATLRITHRSALLTAGATLLAATAAAQTPLVETGDMVPGVGLITRIDDVSISSTGDWIVEADTDNATTSMDNVILENGALKFQEGTSLGIPASVAGNLSSGDRMVFNDAGESIYLLRISLTAGGSRNIVLWKDILVLEEDVTPFSAPGAPAGAIWDSIAEVWMNSNQEMLVGGRLDSGEDVAAVLTFDAMGAIVSESILAIDGTTLAGHNAEIQGFSFSRRRQAINASGQTLWFVDDQQTTPGGMSNTCCDSWIYMDGMPILHESEVVPATGQLVGTLSSCEVDLNDAGDWVAQMAQNPSTFNQDVILKNGTEVIAAEGAGLPSIPAGFVISAMGSTTGVFLTNGGDVVWHAAWDDPDTSMNNGVFLNQELFLQEGVSTVGGQTISSIAAGDNTMEVSRDGRFLIIELTLADGTAGAYLFDLERSVGTPYCGPAPANSTGTPGVLAGEGTPIAVDNDVALVASGLPSNAFGFFLVSFTQGFVTNPGGSQGNLCLGGAIGRYVSAGQIQNSGAAGEFSLMLDLTNTPQPTATIALVAGDTANFQGWYRDSIGGMAVSNLTNGLSITFE